MKTTHTKESTGFIVSASKGFAYLVDSIAPPSRTIDGLADLDLLILEGTVDELVLKEGEKWYNFSVQEAIDFWQQVGTPECILTHLACHSWKYDHLEAGFTPKERTEFEAKYPGLRFAQEGMRLKLE